MSLSYQHARAYDNGSRKDDEEHVGDEHQASTGCLDHVADRPSLPVAVAGHGADDRGFGSR